MSYIRIQITSYETMLLHRLFQVSIVTVTLPWLCRSGAVRRLISVWTKLRGATSITKRLVGRSVGWSVLRWLAPLLPSCHSWWVRLARSVVSDPRSKCRCVGIARRQRASTSRCRRKKRPNLLRACLRGSVLSPEEVRPKVVSKVFEDCLRCHFYNRSVNQSIVNFLSGLSF